MSAIGTFRDVSLRADVVLLVPFSNLLAALQHPSARCNFEVSVHWGRTCHQPGGSSPMRLQRISWWVFLLLLVCACPRSSSTGYGSAVGTTDDAAPVEIDEALSNALDSQGQRTPVALRVVHGFSGNNDQGPEETALTFPASATSDSFWTGSFDGDEAASRRARPAARDPTWIPDSPTHCAYTPDGWGTTPVGDV